MIDEKFWVIMFLVGLFGGIGLFLFVLLRMFREVEMNWEIQ